MEHRRIFHSSYNFSMSFHSFRCAPLVKRHNISMTRGRSTGLPYQRMKEPIKLLQDMKYENVHNDNNKYKTQSIKLT